jgi:hypothetical protein
MIVEVRSTVAPAPPVSLADSPGNEPPAAGWVGAGTRALGAVPPAAVPPAAVLGRLGEFGPRALETDPAGLALDLTDPVTPGALAEILHSCLRDIAGAAPTPELLRATPVGDRIAALMAVAAATGDGTFSAAVRCPADGCGENLEVEVTWDEIRTIAETTAREPFAVEIDGLTFVVRRPEAADQDGLARASASGAEPTPRDVVAGLLVDGPASELTPERVTAIEAALDERDPLICFTVGIGCPSCGSVADQEIPLVSIGAAVIRRQQARMLDDVHDLARAYGWSEGEILAIPAWRRARYRARIAADR